MAPRWALGFASDNRRFAAGCISAVDGQVSSRIFLMDCGADDPVALYEADAGSLILHLYWLDSQHVLAVLSDYAVLLDASTGAETARYDYGGASLVDVDTAGSGVALLLTGGGDASLILLDNSLAPAGPGGRRRGRKPVRYPHGAVPDGRQPGAVPGTTTAPSSGRKRWTRRRWPSWTPASRWCLPATEVSVLTQ